MLEIGTKICQTNKKKQKGNMEEIGTETLKKKQAEMLIFCIV